MRNATDLISELQELDWDQLEAAGSQAAPVLRRLRSQGADALIPIRDYLLDGRSDRTSSALRQALLEVLLSLGLPEVEDVALELLAAGPVASEMWQLGRYLDSVRPGRYSDSIRSAAELALMEADPSMVLPPEFFALLGQFGNVETALLLGGAPPHHEAYASLTLAQLGDESGLSILEQHARLFESGRDTMQGRLALQLLAQTAPQSSEAAAALIDLAEQGVIPDDLWPHVLDIVAGNWELTLIEPPAELLVGSHTFYRPEGDQVIWRAARPPYGADDGLNNQRLYLLDRLQPLAPPDLASDSEP